MVEQLNTVVQIIPPNPVYSDLTGGTVTQLNMVVLGGPNGLNAHDTMNLDNLIKKILREENEYRSGRYMFFQNLQQMRRQCDLLLDLEPEMIEDYFR